MAFKSPFYYSVIAWNYIYIIKNVSNKNERDISDISLIKSKKKYDFKHNSIISRYKNIFIIEVKIELDIMMI